jgi:hypothetical protein
MKRTREQGFSPVEIIVTVLIIGLLVGVGYMVMKRRSADTAKTSTVTSGAVDDAAVPAAPQIQSTTDLDTSVQTLDEAQLNSSDSSALDTQMNGL